MQQNTDSWLEWRRQGLGASDATIIMGLSPYKTRFQLWQDKLGLGPKESGETFITEMGHRFEPRARAQFALETGIDLKADVCLEHPEFKYLRASLDGICEKERVFAEIKLVGKKKIDWIRTEQRPLDEHLPQVQQQFLVTGFQKGFYIAYQLDENHQDIVDYVMVPVFPQPMYIDKLFKELAAFWTLVKTQEPPDLADKDIYEFTDKTVIAKADAYRKAKLQFETLEATLEKMSDDLKAIASVHAKVKMGALTISKVVRKGNVDYKKVPALKGLDLEPYRAKPSTYQKITAEK